MATKSYSNREIKQLFELSDAQHANAHQVMLTKIEMVEHLATATLAQATKTNGRVTEAEAALNAFGRWRAYITGALAILAFMLSGVLIIAGAIITSGGKL